MNSVRRKNGLLEVIKGGENEFVVNAIVHRDYKGVHSQFRIYPDKIVLWNDGKLPPELTIDDIKQGNKRSYPRNKLIAEVFRDCGFIKRYGSGVARAIKEFKEYGLPEPEIKEEITGICVEIYGNKAEKESQKTREKTMNEILKLMKGYPEITIKELSEKTGLSEKGIEWNIKKLKEENSIRRVVPDKGGHWEVIEDA